MGPVSQLVYRSSGVGGNHWTGVGGLSLRELQTAMRLYVIRAVYKSPFTMQSMTQELKTER